MGTYVFGCWHDLRSWTALRLRCERDFRGIGPKLWAGRNTAHLSLGVMLGVVSFTYLFCCDCYMELLFLM